jgi:plastocyanin
MSGSVVVNPQGTPYPQQQAFYDQQSAQESFTILGQGLNLFINGLETAIQSGPKQVTAGIGASTSFSGNVFVPRFEPALRIVHKGDTVTWTNLDPETPHTISIGPDPANPAAPSGSTTVTTAPGATALNSGFIGAPFGKKSFAVTFDNVGTYSYFCALHDTLGMKGTVLVLP